MSKSVLKELPDLVQNKIITEEVAQQIQEYYSSKQSSSNRLLIVFSILGALLTGLGIILIIAHNWDELPKALKLSFALLPMLIGQLACGLVLFKGHNESWKREASATFLFFSIAASISIVSQVYNIEGSLSGFLFIWMILSLPVIYVMRSSMTSLFYICGVTWYACELSYFHYPSEISWWYWPLLLAIIPYYYSLSKTLGNFFNFHSWLIGLSMIICLGTLNDKNDEMILIAYISLLSAFVSLGQLRPYANLRLISNAFLIIGSLGIISMFLSLSFEWYWNELAYAENMFSSQEFVIALVTTLFASYFLYRCMTDPPQPGINLKSFAFLIYIVLFAIGINLPVVSQILINVTVLVFAVFTMLSGARQDRLSILNYGLLIVTALIICRFFDTNMSFVFRGLLFVAVGVSFFTANYYMIKKRNRTIV